MPKQSKRADKAERVRTIASEGAESVGRFLLPTRDATRQRYSSNDDGPMRDEWDNNRTPGTVVGHFYTEPIPRRGVISTPVREPAL